MARSPTPARRGQVAGARKVEEHKIGCVREVDFEAVTVVAVGSVVNRSVIDATLGIAAPVGDLAEAAS